jgi:hypothetical protein
MNPFESITFQPESILSWNYPWVDTEWDVAFQFVGNEANIV